MRVGSIPIWRAVIVSAALTALPAQPPPPRPDAETVARRISDVRRHLARHQQTTAEGRELVAFASKYLDAASVAQAGGRWRQADRFAEAADACRRPLDHLEHLSNRSRPDPPHDLKDHLRQVYFRLRMGSIFLQEIPSPAPKRLLEIARHFYDRALKAHQAGDDTTTDEYAKAADDLTHALESLAHAWLPDAATGSAK